MKPIIFCDFDGTITETDNIFSLMTEFVPEESEKIAQAMMEQTISFKDGLSAMFHLLSTHQKDEVIQYLMESESYVRDLVILPALLKTTIFHFIL